MGALQGRLLSFIKMSGFSLLLGSYGTYNGYLTGFKRFRMGRWVYTPKVGFEPESWASTWKADFRVFEPAWDGVRY